MLSTIFSSVSSLQRATAVRLDTARRYVLVVSVQYNRLCEKLVYTFFYSFLSTMLQDKVRDYWTIHGLWPTNATSWPQNCDPSHPFDPSKIANLRPELDKYWPSVTSENSDGFWSHEWSKHGTCAKAVPQLSGEYNYFSFTLTLYSKWNLTQYLNDAQIYPDNDRAYDISQIEDVLDKNLEAKANLVCENVRGLQYPLLTEIHFCLTKTLDVMDCPTKDEKCGNDSIYYIKSA